MRLEHCPIEIQWKSFHHHVVGNGMTPEDWRRLILKDEGNEWKSQIKNALVPISFQKLVLDEKIFTIDEWWGINPMSKGLNDPDYSEKTETEQEDVLTTLVFEYCKEYLPHVFHCPKVTWLLKRTVYYDQEMEKSIRHFWGESDVFKQLLLFDRVITLEEWRFFLYLEEKNTDTHQQACMRALLTIHDHFPTRKKQVWFQQKMHVTTFFFHDYELSNRVHIAATTPYLRYPPRKSFIPEKEAEEEQEEYYIPPSYFPLPLCEETTTTTSSMDGGNGTCDREESNGTIPTTPGCYFYEKEEKNDLLDAIQRKKQQDLEKAKQRERPVFYEFEEL